MEPKTICQSCGMPIDDLNLLGTEADGSKSTEYCKYCYQQGYFVQPDMDLDDMRLLVKKVMNQKQMPTFIIEQAVSTLPELKRWRAATKSNSFIL